MAYQIFELADGRRAALYAQGNSIFSCLLPFMRGMVPGEVRSDYLAHLDAAVFRDTVCFVYENLEHKVIVDTLGAAPARILLSDTGGYGFDHLQLIVRENGLYLFYQVRRKGEKAGLYVCMPYQENVWGIVFEGQDGVWEVQALRTDGGMQLLCLDKRSGKVRLYDWKGDAEFSEIRFVESSEHEKCLENLKAGWQEEKERLEGAREELQAEAMAKLGEFQQEKEERLIQCRKEYENRVERLRAEYEEKLAKCRKGYESQLDEAKRQYNELAQTAVKLQQIGRKWRDKYFGRTEEKEKI
ncbi:MAG TPA: hypothetical protein H9717_08705 [Candidatus Eisenbergiella merdipullorum]|uniref:Uncharacterized protein n=1 Tax=Candidatus Eisenbergiella merdipullorum TaxID=2838553 RepID=A0A9D2I7C6_9FIRM|nr:hypothetical protein [Candidatus Eisenbergiella merdipullorum]